MAKSAALVAALALAPATGLVAPAAPARRGAVSAMLGFGPAAPAAPASALGPFPLVAPQPAPLGFTAQASPSPPSPSPADTFHDGARDFDCGGIAGAGEWGETIERDARRRELDASATRGVRRQR